MELILVLNGGSSNLKATLFEGEKRNPIWEERVEWEKEPSEEIEKALKNIPIFKLSAIGHRVVHGGEEFKTTVRINSEVKRKIKDLFFLAPLHNPVNLAGIEACEKIFRGTPQFAVFDTAFHQTMPPCSYIYPIPLKYLSLGVRRYGFHGISFAYCSKRCAALLKGSIENLKVVICHLGAGASLCALKGGKSWDTTMGMTPLEGLMMATRSGSIDPGIILHLLKEQRVTVEELDQELNFESGLLGISEMSGDMRELEEAFQKGNPQATLALEIFLYRFKKYLGALIASLEGIDVLVFTGGIGEHSAFVREKGCESFSFLGLEIDKGLNRSSSLDERVISTLDSKIRVLVIPTREEWQIREELKTLHI